MNNLYNRLFKYKPQQEISSCENFITETFVHLLEFSLSQKTPFVLKFMEFLEHAILIEDYEKTFIDTQRTFETSYNLWAIPDITIQIKDSFYFIEVKYDSSINIYTLPGNIEKKINQIEKYQGIKLPLNSDKHIYTLSLSKANIDFDKQNKDFQKEILWQHVYFLLLDYRTDNSVEKYLHNEYKNFMEDNKMAIPKVSYELVNGMQSLNNLFQQIETALEDLNIPFNRSFGYSWSGYYMFKTKKKTDNLGFIGTYWEKDRLTFTFANEIANKNILDRNIESDFERQKDNKVFCKYFEFEKECFFCLQPEEQLEKITGWINENNNLLINLST
ncbi:MAG: hypothetical protein KAS71_14195 [Bacteroidales bacterium]|nr:hypothetical protein [Bacteroidales bacterium]